MKRETGLSVVHSAANLSEAEIVRSILESRGIFAVIPDKNIPLPVDLHPLDDEFRVTSCEVQVRSEDVPRAKTLIAEAREAGRLNAEEGELTDSELEGDELEEDEDLDDDDLGDDDFGEDDVEDDDVDEEDADAFEEDEK